MAHSFLTGIDCFSVIDWTPNNVFWFGSIHSSKASVHFLSLPLDCFFAVFPDGLLFVQYVCVFNNHITYSALAEFHNSQICIVSLSKQLQ